MVREHKLVKYEYQSQNRADLQHYVECSCGFQGRSGTEQSAKSQFDNHLLFHGAKPYFQGMVAAVESKKQEAPVLTSPKTGLTPIGNLASTGTNEAPKTSVAGAWTPEGAK